jgi:Ca2+-dependent lipid-binding protein
MNAIKGKLTVKVIEAKLSRDTEMFASMSPYVKLLCGGVECQTKIHESGGKTPSWNQSFHFNIVGERTLTFKVMDKDTFSSDTVGECTIKLDDVYMEKHIQKWYSIIYENVGAGQIHI